MGLKITPVTFTTVIVISISAGVCVYLLIRKKWEEKIPKEWNEIGRVKNLFIFPLKSGHYTEINAAECTQVGFKMMKNATNYLQLRDRSFSVYGEKDLAMKSARTIPALVTIHLSVQDENHIALDAPQMQTLFVKIPEKKQDNKIFLKKEWLGETFEAIDCGNLAARWLSQTIAQKDSGYRLGYHESDKPRWGKRNPNKATYDVVPDTSSGLFSDYTSIMAVNESSVNDFNKRVPGDAFPTVIFRPNIVIDGPEPYDEDNWKWLKIGEVIMKNVKICTRCVFTIVHPETGKRHPDREPLTTLSTYRMNKGLEKAPVMGIHLEVKKMGLIKCGDPVYIDIG